MVKRYEFEGELLSAGQIAKRYPAYSASTVALACSQGCKSLADLQERDRKAIANTKRAQAEAIKGRPPICASKAKARIRGIYRDELCGMGLRS